MLCLPRKYPKTFWRAIAFRASTSAMFIFFFFWQAKLVFYLPHAVRAHKSAIVSSGELVELVRVLAAMLAMQPTLLAESRIAPSELLRLAAFSLGSTASTTSLPKLLQVRRSSDVVFPCVHSGQAITVLVNEAGVSCCLTDAVLTPEGAPRELILQLYRVRLS